MKENGKENIMDDKQWMKAMMESARKKPSENLSYRIMHQIENEQTVKYTNSKSVREHIGSPLSSLSILGLMYLALLVTGSYFYWLGGKEALMTESFLWYIIAICSTFSFLFLIISFDNSIGQRRKSRCNSSKMSVEKV